MPLTPEQKRWALQQSGYNPDQYDLDDDGYASPRVAAQPAATADTGRLQPKLEAQPAGALSTFGSEALNAAPSAAIGGLGTAVGMAFGAGLAPATGGLSLAIPLLTGLVTGVGSSMGASYLQDTLEQKLKPERYAQRLTNLQAHPTAGMLGRLAALPVGGMNPNLPNVGKAAGTLLSRATGAQSKINPMDMANLANVGIGSALGAGIPVGQQLAQGRGLGEAITSPETLEGLLGGAVFNKPNTLGVRMGFAPEVAPGQHALDAQAPAVPDEVIAREIIKRMTNPVQATQNEALGVLSKPEGAVVGTGDAIIESLNPTTTQGMNEVKEGKWMMPRENDLLTANQAAEQRGINPAKAAAMEAERVAQAGLLTPEAIYQQKVQKEIARLNKQRQQVELQKAQVELQQATQGLQQTMQKSAIGQPQPLPKPRAVTELGKEIYPDYTGVQEADKMAVEADTAGAEADAIQDKLEGKRVNQEAGEELDPTIHTALRQKVAESTTTPEVTDFAKSLLDAQAHKRGIDVGTTDEKGSYALLADSLKRMAAKIGTKEGSDTRAHEFIGHIFNKMLELSPYASDKRVQKQMLDAAAKSPELAAINEARAKAGKEAWTPDEFVANQQGLHWLTSSQRASGESANAQWYKNWKAELKSVFNRATPEDLRRIVDYKWHNDAPFNEYFKLKDLTGVGTSGVRVNYGGADSEPEYIPFESAKPNAEVLLLKSGLKVNTEGLTPAQIAALKTEQGAIVVESYNSKTKNAGPFKLGDRVNQPFDEGFNTKEGDDVLSNPQEDIEVNDALPTKLAPPPEGYRRVRVVPKEGAPYEAFFNDQYFPGTGKFFQQEHDLASIAKYTEKGDVTHTATKPGDRIEEIKDQLYRREQPEGEGLYDKAAREMAFKETLAGVNQTKAGEKGKRIADYLIDRLNIMDVPVREHPELLGNINDVLTGDNNHPQAVDWVLRNVYEGNETKMLNDMTTLLGVQRDVQKLEDLRNFKRDERGALRKYQQPEGEALTPEDRYNAKLAKMRAYKEANKEKLNARHREDEAAKQAEHVALREASGDTENLVNKEGNPNIKDVKRPITVIPKRLKVSLDAETETGAKLGDTIADPNAVIPGETIADADIENLPKTGETLEQRIERKANEELAKIQAREEASPTEAPSSEAEQVRGKTVAPTEAVHTSELDMSFAHMGDIVEQRIKELNEDLAAAEKAGENTEGIEALIEKQEKMLEFIKTQDLTKKVDLKSLKKVYQPSEESLSPREKQQNSPEFKRWFGDSKVVDENGKPLVVYHGNNRDFSTFDSEYSGKAKPNTRIEDYIDAKEGFFFAKDPNFAEQFTKYGDLPNRPEGHIWNYDEFFNAQAAGGNIKPVYLSIKNPKHIKYDQWNLPKVAKQLRDARASGYDGAILESIEDYTKSEGYAIDSFVAFHPEQIKSATGNSGEFNPANPDIRYQKPEESLQPRTIYDKTGAVGKGLRYLIAPEIEKLRAESPIAAKAATKFLEINRAKRGELEQTAIRSIQKARPAASAKEWALQDNPDFQAVVKWRDLKQDGIEPNFKLTPVQEKISKAIDASNLQTYKERESRPGLKRETGQTPFYLGQALARKAAKILAEHPRSPEARKYFADFIKYRTEVKHQSKEAATKDWETLRGQFTLNEDTNISAKFGAIDKAAGLGYPISMREQHLIDRMARYTRRYARRIAYEDAINANPEAKKEFFDQDTGVASTKAGRNVLEDIFGIREHNEATRSAISGFIRAAMLGPLTGAKDVVAGQVLGLQHMDLGQVLPAKASSLANWKANYEKAIKTGVVRNNIAMLELGDGSWSQMQGVLERSRDIINTVQGRNLLENTARTLAFGEGMHLAMDAVSSLKTGNLTGAKRGFLEDFIPEWKDYKKGEVPTSAIEEAAAKYVESVQGTYDYRGLPSIVTKGTLSPVVSLARWNVEKFNNFTKHVVEPATKGNYKPLLMSTIGMLIGGAAVEKLVEETSGRKLRTPSWKEVSESKHDVQMAAYKLAGLASMSGYMGVLGDVTKNMLDRYYGNRAQTWSNPLIQGLDTAVEDIGFIQEALEKEGPSLKLVTDAITMFMNDYVQAHRVATAQLPEKREELADVNKRRDLRVYQMGEGQNLSPASTQRVNPLVDAKSRTFKRTDDIQEAVSLVPDLIDEAIEASKDEAGNVNPEELKKNLSKLKRNTYQTVPSPETSPLETMKYMDFLGRTQGTDEASRRLEDYMRRNALNRAKSSMIPNL